MHLTSIYPPISFQSPVSKQWFIICGGQWIETDRQFTRQELDQAWTKLILVQSVQPTVDQEWTVQGTKEYTVRCFRNTWTCTCPSAAFRRQTDCKHIKQIQSQLTKS